MDDSYAAHAVPDVFEANGDTAAGSNLPIVLWEDLPAEAPLEMPVQPISGSAALHPAPAPGSMALRRCAVFGATAILAVGCFSAPQYMFSEDGFSVLEILALIVAVPLFIGICCWFSNAVAGFLRLTGPGADELNINAPGPPPRPKTRTALLAPVHNEDPQAVFARLAAIDRSLAGLGLTRDFDLYVLSDSSDASIIAQERMRFFDLKRSAKMEVFYRRRAAKVGRKAGNVAEWVRRFGGAYEQMIVLDADSLMTGETMARLVAAMERRPDIGLIQTVPIVIHGESLFARYMQFGVRVYSRVATAGLAWWTGAEGTYWGHNAAVRTRAFAEQCGLPKLPGPKPFGGEVMSHDVVEAALLRRGGWGVHLAPTLVGSYEESPPTIVEFSVRDRRWCQGNLQHVQLMFAPGLHWVSRLQFMIGFMSYMISPLWLVFLVAGVSMRLSAFHPGDPSYSTGEDFVPVAFISVLTMIMLIGPKLLGFFWIMLNKAERMAFGGGWRLLRSMMLEMLLSAAFAPIIMLTQTRAMIEIMLGRDSGWGAQTRSAQGLSWSDAVKQYGGHSLTGIVLLIGFMPDTDLVIWTAPIIFSLIAATPLAMLTSRADLGAAARDFGLLTTPEELNPASVMHPTASHALGQAEGWETAAPQPQPAAAPL